ncbi:MAG TPA: efflux RND transporter periplasmic adaptor subunit [Terracidiphilus sp.]
MKIFFGCFLAASLVTIDGCHSDESAAPVPAQTMQARVVESRQQEAPLTLRATGTLHARESAMITAQVMGRIEQVLVREGDSVRAGQALVALDDATLRASAEQAQAAVKAVESQEAAAQSQFALAASTLARYKQLQAEKSISAQEMDEVTRRAEAAAAGVDAVRAQRDAAKAQESGARAMLGFTRLSAPFAGVVTARMVDPGTMAAPGVPLLQIESAGPLQLEAAVDESIIGSIRKGMKISVTTDGVPNGAATGTVAEIVPAADPSSHSFLVKIDLAPSAQLHAGMYGSAQIATGAHPAILIPRSAVVLRGSLSCVYVLDANGMAQLRSITVGAAQGEMVEALSGISSNEKLVDLPGDRDLAGKRIEAE